MSRQPILANFAAVIVTGGSSGIGKSFIELGGSLRPGLVFCNLSRRPPAIPLPELKLRHFPCDFAQPGALAAAVPDLVAHLEREAPRGEILLINNSGFGTYGVFPEPNVRENLEMLDVNIRALVELTGALLPLLRRRGGAVLTVASTAAFQPTPYLATYGATKAFVLHWTLALNEEWRGTNLRALAVCPGPTATEFFHRAGLRAGSVPDAMSMTSAQVVTAAYQALAAGRSLVVTGWKNRLLAALSSLLPKPWVARVSAGILARARLQRVGR